MTFWIVLNNRERGIKHAVCLTAPHFLIEDAPSIVVTCVLPVATCSDVSWLSNSSKWFCSFSGGAFTELCWENPVALFLSRKLPLCPFWPLRPDQNDLVILYKSYSECWMEHDSLSSCALTFGTCNTWLVAFAPVCDPRPLRWDLFVPICCPDGALSPIRLMIGPDFGSLLVCSCSMLIEGYSAPTMCLPVSAGVSSQHRFDSFCRKRLLQPLRFAIACWSWSIHCTILEW